MTLWQRIFGRREVKCDLPDDLRTVVQSIHDEADSVSDLLRQARERNLLQGALAPVKRNGTA